ncbi:hypothetical protein [Acetobacterium wieringae]
MSKIPLLDDFQKSTPIARDGQGLFNTGLIFILFKRRPHFKRHNSMPGS